MAGDAELHEEEEAAVEELDPRALDGSSAGKVVLEDEGIEADLFSGLDSDEEQRRWQSTVDRTVGGEKAESGDGGMLEEEAKWWTVTPCFSQRNKTSETTDLNKQICLMYFMSMHIFFVLMCAI
jgi:hypothetical protein